MRLSDRVGALQRFDGGLNSTQAELACAERNQRIGGEKPLRLAFPLEDGQSAARRHVGLVEAAYAVEELAVVGQEPSGLRVIDTEAVLDDAQRRGLMFDGLRGLAQAIQAQREVIDRQRQVRVIRAEELLLARHGAPRVVDRRGWSSLRLMDGRSIREQ